MQREVCGAAKVLVAKQDRVLTKLLERAGGSLLFLNLRLKVLRTTQKDPERGICIPSR